jgi:hypothetical protein
MSSRVSEISLRLKRFSFIPKIVCGKYEKYFLIITTIFDQIFQHTLMIWAGRIGICFQSLYVIAKVANRFGWIDFQQLEDQLIQFLAQYLYPQQHQQDTFSLNRCYG